MEIFLVLGTPLIGAALLALWGHRRFAAELNVAMSTLTFVAAGMLTARVVTRGPMTSADNQFFVDPLNVFLVALTAFVAMTTAVFSRPYMRIEAADGHLGERRLRLYHSMYQLFTFTMLLVLLTNNMGILWVATEAATLSTVLLVSLYRTPASLEAAWKYFILCGVGIAQALFGTILLYFAAERVLGGGGDALLQGLSRRLVGVDAALGGVADDGPVNPRQREVARDLGPGDRDQADARIADLGLEHLAHFFAHLFLDSFNAVGKSHDSVYSQESGVKSQESQFRVGSQSQGVKGPKHSTVRNTQEFEAFTPPSPSCVWSLSY